MTAAATIRALPAHRPPRPVPGRAPRGAPFGVAPSITERLLYMCDAARDRERRGESATQLHGFCRGYATNPVRALGALRDPDGRLRAGRHRCTCPCHIDPAREPSTGPS